MLLLLLHEACCCCYMLLLLLLLHAAAAECCVLLLLHGAACCCCYMLLLLLLLHATTVAECCMVLLLLLHGAACCCCMVLRVAAATSPAFMCDNITLPMCHSDMFLRGVHSCCFCHHGNTWRSTAVQMIRGRWAEISLSFLLWVRSTCFASGFLPVSPSCFNTAETNTQLKLIYWTAEQYPWTVNTVSHRVNTPSSWSRHRIAEGISFMSRYK